MRTQADDYKDCSANAQDASTSRASYQSYGRCALDAACDTYGLGDLCAQLGPVVDAVVGAVYDAFSHCGGLDGDAYDCCKDPSLPKCFATNSPEAPFGSIYHALAEAAIQVAALLPTAEVTKQPGGWVDKSTGSGYVVRQVTDAERLDNAEYLLAQVLSQVNPDRWKIEKYDGRPMARTWLSAPSGHFGVGQQSSMTGQQIKDYRAHVWPGEVAARQADIVFACSQVIAAHAGDLDAQAKAEALAAESAQQNATGGGSGGVAAVAVAGGLGLLGFLLLR